MESHKIMVDGEGLRTLAVTCRRNGTQDAWIDVALTWINAAEPEIVRLRSDLAAARDAAFSEGVAANMIAEERDALQRALNQCRDLLKLECESVAPLRERIATLEAERDALVDALQSVRALARAIAHHPESMIDLCDAAIDAARAALKEKP